MNPWLYILREAVNGNVVKDSNGGRWYKMGIPQADGVISDGAGGNGCGWLMSGAGGPFPQPARCLHRIRGIPRASTWSTSILLGLCSDLEIS